MTSRLDGALAAAPSMRSVKIGPDVGRPGLMHRHDRSRYQIPRGSIVAQAKEVGDVQ
jgi:hypothetical protein